MYLHSSSELQRVSLSAQHSTQAHCHLELPPGARPNKVNEDIEEESVQVTQLSFYIIISVLLLIVSFL